VQLQMRKVRPTICTDTVIGWRRLRISARLPVDKRNPISARLAPDDIGEFPTSSRPQTALPGPIQYCRRCHPTDTSLVSISGIQLRSVRYPIATLLVLGLGRALEGEFVNRHLPTEVIWSASLLPHSLENVSTRNNTIYAVELMGNAHRLRPASEGQWD